MKKVKSLKLSRFLIASCVFLIFSIGNHIYATNIEKLDSYFLPMTIDYDTKSHMIYDTKAAKFAINVSQSACGNPKNSSEWSHAYNENNFDSSLVIENEKVIMFRENIEEIDEYGNTSWSLKDIYSSVNTIIGVKTINDINGNDIYLISVGFRGTDMLDPADIATDLNVSNFLWGGSIHQGFYNTATAFYEMRNSIVLNIKGQNVSLGTIINEMKNENSQYKMIVAGHSLGGAVTDVFIGHTLRNAGVKEYNVTGYTFAAPKSVTSSYANSANVKNIINIVNADDWIANQSITGKAHLGQTFVVTPSIQYNTSAHTIWTTYPDRILVDLEANIQNFTTLNTVKGIIVNNANAYIRNHSINYIDTYITIGNSSKLTFDSGANVYITGDTNQKTASRLVVDNGSNVYVDGDYTMDTTPYGASYLDVLSGKLEIGGNLSNVAGGPYYHRMFISDELIIRGDLNIYHSLLGMIQPTSYIKIYGDTTIQGLIINEGQYQVTDGNIEMLGNYSSDASTGNATVKLSGDKKQIITGTTTNIPIIELANTSEEGVEFVNKIFISKLFNHNNLHYILDNGGTFVDYDGDGVKDNLDQYPTDPTRW